MKRLIITALLGAAGHAAAQVQDCAANRNSSDIVLIGKDGHYFSSKYDLVLPAVEESLPHITKLASTLKAQGVTLVVVPVPHSGIVNTQYLDPKDALQKGYDAAKARSLYSSFVNRLKQSGVAAVDLLSIADANKGRYLLKSDWHWTPDGAQLSAQAVAKLIQSLPAGKTLPQKAFTTTKKGQLTLTSRDGFYTSNLMKRCGTSLVSDETINTYTTTAPEGGLLDDEDPQVVLAGTSFSQIPTWHFEGFLKSALQTDVLNVSLVAGGVHSALLDWLRGGGLASKPKVVVWEFDLGRLQKNVVNDGLWMSLDAAAQANCKTAAQSVPNTNGAYQFKAAANQVVKAEFSKPDVVSFTLTDAAGKDSFISRTSYMATKPVYFFPTTKAGTYTIKASSNAPKDASLKVTFCGQAK